MTRTPEEIDQLFDHLANELEHSPDDPMHWRFNVVGADEAGLEAAGQKGVEVWQEFGRSVDEDAEFEVGLAENVEHKDDGSTVESLVLCFQAIGTLSAEQIKALAQHVEAYAAEHGLTFEDLDCTDATDWDEYMDWMSLEDAQWRLSNLTDSGVPAGAPLPYVFAITATERTTLESVAQALADAGHEDSEIHSDPDEPEDVGLIVRVEGKNDADSLAASFASIESVVRDGAGELLGVQFFDDNAEDDLEDDAG